MDFVDVIGASGAAYRFRAGQCGFRWRAHILIASD